MNTELLRRPVGTAVREMISKHVRLHGTWDDGDGRLTVLTVNWNTLEHTRRMLRSVRRFLPPGTPVVVVDNSPSRTSRRALAESARYATAGVNLNHGLGLDFGMRLVETEYVLVCDPDTAIVSPTFREELVSRLHAHGVAAVDTGNPHYHPLCVAFRTEHWKRGGFSFEQRWPYWDVGGELTHLLGGVDPAALIPKSRSFGTPLPSAAGGDGMHHLGEVYGDVFTSVYLSARLVAEPDRVDFDGWSRSTAVAYHQRWERWVDAVLDGSADCTDFPTDDPFAVRG